MVSPPHLDRRPRQLFPCGSRSFVRHRVAFETITRARYPQWRVVLASPLVTSSPPTRGVSRVIGVPDAALVWGPEQLASLPEGRGLTRRRRCQPISFACRAIASLFTARTSFGREEQSSSAPSPFPRIGFQHEARTPFLFRVPIPSIQSHDPSV